MPISLAPPMPAVPPIAETLDAGESVIIMAPAPAFAPPPEASVFSSTSLPSTEDNSIFATLIVILIGLWVAKMILGLIPRFLLIGVGLAILYAYLF